MMMMSLLLVVLLAAVVTADLSASSPLGSRLLSKARRLNGDDDGYDYSWVTNYSIKFHSCHNILSFRGDSGSEDEDGSPTELERLVLFKLCPTNSCSTCKHGAEYLVEMREFVESYLESKMSQQEYNCETVENNCNCDDDATDDDACLAQCYAVAGLDYCENDEDNDDDGGIDVDEYLECEQVGDNDDDSSNSLYVGAYCSSNGASIYLGAFSDRQCTQASSASDYQTLTGYTLPYTSTSLVSHDCVSCREPTDYDDDYNADQYDADAVTEFCEDLYDRSAKCEKSLQNVDTTTTSGCDYIHKILPRMERIANQKASGGAIWATIFFLTTLMGVGAAVFFYTKLQRNHGVDLSSQGMGVGA